MLNVTVDEAVAADVRLAAEENGTTISSVVERALAEYLDWERIRAEGLAAMQELYAMEGYPSEQDAAAADAWVAEAVKALDESHQRDAERQASQRNQDRGDAA